MPAELRAFLHAFIDAVAGAGHSDRLHAQLDAIGKPADPAPEPEPPADPTGAAPSSDTGTDDGSSSPTETVPADELASFRAWQAAQATPPTEPVTE